MTAIEKVRFFLKENRLDGILIRKRNNFSWLTNGCTNHIAQSQQEGVCDLFITKDAVYAITLKMEERRIVEEELAHAPFETTVLVEEWFNGSDHLIEKLGEGKVVATDTPFMNWEVVDHKLSYIRSQLTDVEISRYRSLCLDASISVEETCKEIYPSQTEFEIASILSSKVISKGATVQVALIATDERIYKYRHPIPTSKKLNKQAMVVLCAERGGLVANVTRIVHFGQLTEELQKNKKCLANIDVKMNTSTMAGTRVGDVVKAAIEQYASEGFPNDWKLLHQGGPTGYNAREYLANMHSDEIIRTNQVFAWNPALPGVKSEDTILVKEDGVEFLTHTGGWVYLDVPQEDKVLKRPDILLR